MNRKVLDEDGFDDIKVRYYRWEMKWCPSRTWGEMNLKAVYEMRRNEMTWHELRSEEKRREEERREESIRKKERKRERERERGRERETGPERERERERETEKEKGRDRECERERFICLYYCFYFHKFVLSFLPLRTFCLVHFLVFSHFFISHLNSFVLNIHLLIL